MTTRVLLVDDHRLLREGLHSLIEQVPGMTVVGESADGRAAIAAAKEEQPDVVVMDVAMPGLNGIDATRAIVSEVESARVLCLSMHRDHAMVAAVLEAGASGYLLKDCAGTELIEAIRAVHADRTYLSPAVAGRLVRDYVSQLAEARSPDEPMLTTREREILQLLAEGHSTKAIAEQLFISPKTVGSHREHIKAKLKLQTVAELTKYAIRHGLTTAQFGTEA